MSAYPPELPLDDWANDTPMRDRHPQEHNKIARALAAVLQHQATTEAGYAVDRDTFVLRVNGQEPDADGNVVIDLPASGGGGTITKVNGQTGPEVTLEAGDVGAAPSDDSRLTDDRPPRAGTVTSASIVTGGLPPSVITGVAVVTADARLSDTRTPKVHAATHAAGGSDPLSPAAIGALTQALADTRYVRTVNGTAPDGAGNVVVSASGGGTVQAVVKSGGTWGARPTASAAVVVLWIGQGTGPAVVTSGSGGMRTDAGDVFVQQPA